MLFRSDPERETQKERDPEREIQRDLTTIFSFRCTNVDFYVTLGSSMSLELLVWVGGGLLKRVSYFFW